MSFFIFEENVQKLITIPLKLQELYTSLKYLERHTSITSLENSFN